jgi:hypothetical protein
MLSELGKGVLGGVGKAMLIVQTSAADAAPAVSTPATDLASRTAVSSVASSVLGGLGASQGGGFASTASAMQAASGSLHTMEVQFNPSSLHFDASAQSYNVRQMMEHMDSSLPNTIQRDASISMSVELIMDRVQNKDAFLSDKYHISMSDAISGVGAIATEATGGYTVQPQTNALIALLLNAATSLITFRWAEMSFVGIASEARARYTMFSPRGVPIRSKIELRLVQTITSQSEVTYWDKAYKKFFADGTGMTGQGIGGALQKQSFLNFGL